MPFGPACVAYGLAPAASHTDAARQHLRYFTDSARDFRMRLVMSPRDVARGSDLVELAARERPANALVHPARRELIGAGRQRFGSRFDRVCVVALRDIAQRGQQR